MRSKTRVSLAVLACMLTVARTPVWAQKTLLWRNRSSNETQLWFMNSNRIVSRATVVGEDSKPIFVGLPWSVVGVAYDSFAFARPDVVWHNDSTNETQLWEMFNQTINHRATVVDEGGKPIFVGLPWSIVGAGDFNRDHRDDLVWHNGSSNETQLWLMNGNRITSRTTVVAEDGKPIFVGLPWSIVGVGDFNRDGQGDVVWYNSSSNETQLWLMSGSRIVSRATVVAEDGKPIFVGLPWSIVGVGDFNGDGQDDLVWHNGSSNETQLWLMNGNRITSRATVVAEDGKPIFVGLPWSIVGVGSFTRDRVPSDPNAPR